MQVVLKTLFLGVLVVCHMPIIVAKRVMDIAFLADASGSVGPRGFRIQLEAIVAMSEVFGISRLGSHVSVVVHSTSSRRVISFGDFITLRELKSRIYAAPFQRGHTRVDLALKSAVQQVFTDAGNAREYVPKIAILFIDGKQSTNGKADLEIYNKQLQELGVTLYIVGIGTHVNRVELEKMTTKRDDVFYVYNFNTLQKESVKIAEGIYKKAGAIYSESEYGKFQCSHPIDLGFIVQSEKLGVRKLRRVKQYMSDLANLVGVDGTRSKAGLVLLNDRNNSTQIKFNDVTSKESFSKLLTDMSDYISGLNDVAKGLQTANTDLFSRHSRPAASRVAVLVVFGKKSKNSLLPRLIASQMKAREIKIIVLGIGTELDYTELSEVASKLSLFTPVKSIRYVGKQIMPLAQKICAESVPTARGFHATASAYNTISVKWQTPIDPDNIITGYVLFWQLVENEKGENIINSPPKSKQLSTETSSYEVKDLRAFSFYDIRIEPQWRDGVRGDVSYTRVRTLPDENECLTNPCDVNAQCYDTPRSFYCTCNDGYSGDGLVCADDNECEAGVCSINADCTNLPGSYKCDCKTGFSGNGVTCTDNNECNDIDRCDTNAECSNTIGSYTCECNLGYTGDGESCSDINECLKDQPCSVNATCTNNPGSFQCECNNGYLGDGFKCQDINECLKDQPCSVDATCTNNPGSFQCECNNGYLGDGFKCQDINECLKDQPCSVDATCTNNPGSFQCECNNGYRGNGFKCQDINECEDFNEPCDVNAICTNFPGNHTCHCKPGYTGNGQTCADIDECINNGPCAANGECTNKQGSYDCKCKLGYQGDGFTCTDFNECDQVENVCDAKAECFNTDGSFYCECNIGYNGNGRVCTAVNICSYPMDLTIAIDTSDSINAKDFETQKEAIIMLARSFGLSKRGTHVAVILYGSDANNVIKLGEHNELEAFSKAVRQIKHSGGSTRIDKALNLASSQVFSSKEARSGMPKMLIIMTDGQQTSAPDSIPLKLAVTPLRSVGVKIITIAIGKEVDEYELIAISETKDNIYHVISFETLFDTIKEVGQSLCAKAKKECRSHADIAILVDSSASMRGGNYVKQKSLIKAIGREFDVSLHGSHVSLVVYNTDSDVALNFHNKTTLQEFETIVDNIPLKGGKIRLDKALRLTASDVFVREKGMRDDQPKIMFILTDGTQNKQCEEALELAIAPLRNEGVYVVAVGVGEADQSELRTLVKSTNDLFIGNDFDEVTEPVMKFIKGFCKNNDQSCTVGSQFIDVKVGNCVSEKSVEIGVCDGKCSSGTRYLAETPFYESYCTCCLPRIDSSKEITLRCSDGTTMTHRINEASACECRSCSNMANAPPIIDEPPTPPFP